jgi:hypothetical protein
MPPPYVVRPLTKLFTQAAFYGFYVATLIHCIRWLAYKNEGWKLRDRIDNKLMLITTLLIFLISTVNLVLMLPTQLVFLGDIDSNTPVDVIYVCEYRGWSLEQKKID